MHTTYKYSNISVVARFERQRNMFSLQRVNQLCQLLTKEGGAIPPRATVALRVPYAKGGALSIPCKHSAIISGHGRYG